MAETEQTTASTPAIAYEYVWFGGQPVAQFDAATNTPHWTFTDHLGTPILETNAAGAVDWRAEYDAYGTVTTLRAGAARHQPLRFPGQEYDEASADREYNIFRWYRGGWGRYTQADPIGLGGSLNTYGYVDDDPINAFDPTGEVKHCIHASRTQYIGSAAWEHHKSKYKNPGPQYKYLFNLIIFDARCDDCHEKIDIEGAALEVPKEYAGNGQFNA